MKNGARPNTTLSVKPRLSRTELIAPVTGRLGAGLPELQTGPSPKIWKVERVRPSAGNFFPRRLSLNLSGNHKSGDLRTFEHNKHQYSKSQVPVFSLSAFFVDKKL